MIVLKTINGLGDKLINVIGAGVYCYYKNYDFRAILNQDIYEYYFGSRNFYDLSLFKFNDIFVYNNINEIKNFNLGINWEFVNPDAIASITPYLIYEKLVSENVNVSFEEVSNMFLKYAKNIQPSSLISDYIPKGIENAYGLHLRKSDKIKNKPDIRHEMSPYENDILINKLIEKLYCIIELEERPTFFLSSEDYEYKNYFINVIKKIANYKNKIITIMNISDDIPEKIKSIYNYKSIIDLFSLSRCKSIIQGVRYSAFSVVASLIGNERLINLSKNLESDHLCIIYLWNSVLQINNKLNFDKNSYSNLINKYKKMGLFYGDTYFQKL